MLRVRSQKTQKSQFFGTWARNFLRFRSATCDEFETPLLGGPPNSARQAPDGVFGKSTIFGHFAISRLKDVKNRLFAPPRESQKCDFWRFSRSGARGPVFGLSNLAQTDWLVCGLCFAVPLLVVCLCTELKYNGMTGVCAAVAQVASV